MSYRDRVLFETDTIGTGPIVFVRAGDGYQAPSQAGLVEGDTVSYVLEDGNAWETGRATLNNGVWERALSDSSTNALISLSGNARCFFTVIAEDIREIKERIAELDTGTVTISEVQDLIDQDNVRDDASYIHRVAGISQLPPLP